MDICSTLIRGIQEDIRMIEKVVKKRRLQDSSAKEDLAYWLSRTPVELLRRQVYGNTARLQRIVSVIKRALI